MNILLTGKDGQVGVELQRVLTPLGGLTAVGHRECDLSDGRALSAIVRAVAPDVIVNAAAYTAVDLAESDPAKAFSINGASLGVLGQEAERLGALVIHYSTDYVFDGHKATPYVESDSTNPINVYGQSKLAGELALMQSTARHLILRTSWIMSAHGNNFMTTILRLAAQREHLDVVDDQHGAPTSAALIADVTARLIEQLLLGDTSDAAYGVYHLTAAGHTDWHAYACHVIASARASGYPVRVAAHAIRPVASHLYPAPAKRPANSLLDTSRLRSTFNIELPHWRQGVDEVLQQILRHTDDGGARHEDN
jgi:dTDP-4-dehydrorhamnose reductase